MPFSFLHRDTFRSKKAGPKQEDRGIAASQKRSVVDASFSVSTANTEVEEIEEVDTQIEEEDEDEERPYGIEEWASGVDPEIDLVFIHGLNGHREKTWTASNGVLWPKDLLPKDVPNARVLAFGYDSRFYARKGLSRQTMHGHSMTLLQTLSLYRRKTKTQCRPIIFAAHSLGGIMLKNALVAASIARPHDIGHYQALFTSTYGILFFGTPHHGANYVALANTIQGVASVIIDTNKVILRHLEKDCELSEESADRYRSIADLFETKFFYETVPTRTLGYSAMIVEKSSAVIQGQHAEAIELHKDHREMVRMKSKREGDYQTISTTIQFMCEDATQAVEHKWKEHEKRTDSANPAETSKIEDDYHLPLQLNYKQNVHFTGRQQVLQDLHQSLTISNLGSEEESPGAVVILGIGGVGKTQLARQYAYNYSSHHSPIACINCVSVETVYASFLELARRIISHYASRNREAIPPYSNLAQHLGMPNLIDADGQVVFTHKTRHVVVKAVLDWLCFAGNSAWLLIFDNVDDLESFNICDFFPHTQNGRILITTRRRECTRFGEELQLDVLDESESLKLFQRSCQRRGSFVANELEPAREIVKRLGHLPLAVDQAGAYLHTMQKPIASYLPLLHHTKIKATLGRKPPSAVWSYEQSVFTTWEVSFTEIQKRSPISAEILTLCSFFSHAEIQPEMIERGLTAISTEDLDLDELLAPLLSFSLIARRISKTATATENFSVHPLVHEWARERLTTEEKTRALLQACRLICTSLKPYEIWTTGVRVPQDWHYERQITPHIEAISKWLEQVVSDDDMTIEYSTQLMALANVYYYEGRYTDAEKLYLRALAGREKLLGPDHADVLSVAQGLATVNRFQGKWDESQLLYERALKGRKKIDPNHLDTLATVQSLAVLYRHKGRLEKCVELYNWALYGINKDGKGIESQQGKEHPNTIHTILGYAIVLQHQGKYQHALSLYEEVIAQRTAKLGPIHPDTLTAMHNQGDILRCLGQLERARSIFRHVLDAREQHLGPDHPDTLRTYDGLANVYRDLEKWEESEKLYAKALNGREEKLGFNHADTIATVHHIATSYRMQGKIDEAKVLYVRALDARERDDCLGPHHLHTLRTIEGLGKLAEQKEDYLVAEKHYRRVLEGFQSQMAKYCPDVIRTAGNMARILDKLERHDDAVPYYQQLSELDISDCDSRPSDLERCLT